MRLVVHEDQKDVLEHVQKVDLDCQELVELELDRVEGLFHHHALVRHRAEQVEQHLHGVQHHAEQVWIRPGKTAIAAAAAAPNSSWRWTWRWIRPGKTAIAAAA